MPGPSRRGSWALWASRALRALGVLGLAGGLVLGAPLGAGSSGGAPSRGPGAPVLLRAPAAGSDHACLIGAPAGRPPGPRIAWAALRNPILSSPDAGLKDQALVWAFGRWHMFFSSVTAPFGSGRPVRWQIASSTSTDLSRWSKPLSWPDPAGLRNEASPDLVRSPSGQFVLTFQAEPTAPAGSQYKLYDRTSFDLVHWSSPKPLAAALAPRPDQRQIDPALAWTPAGLLLAYKSGAPDARQAFEMARSTTGALDGPWARVGRPDVVLYGDTLENYELVGVGGRWALLGTSNLFDQPWLFALGGAPGSPRGWLDWTAGRQLMVPGQPWDSGPGISSVDYEHANSAYLCDARAVDGYYYLLYAGSSELTEFGGWGHAEIGIARSRDLVTWQVPPPRSLPVAAG